MNVADSGINWFSAVLMAPFVAVLLAAAAKILQIVYQATQIEGSGELAKAQESAYSGGIFVLDLIGLASSIETWVLLAIFFLSIYAAITARGSRGF